MTHPLDELVKVLAPSPRESDIFRGLSQNLGWGTVFGGQALAQALSAAAQTVQGERSPHSLQAYFLRPGDVSLPIDYEVERIRDGASFTTRRVVGIQHGKPILHVTASFQREEISLEHEEPMPDAPPPESLVDDRTRILAAKDRLPEFAVEWAKAERPIELRMIDPDEDFFHPRKKPAQRMLWFRATKKLSDDPLLHTLLLAYASDFSFVTTVLLPHGITWLTPEYRIASLDHLMWFHRPGRIDDWLLYVMDSPVARGARGFARGTIFTREGRLVASTAQEGLFRKMRKMSE
jgi:acyl-CoA thioesterase-2